MSTSHRFSLHDLVGCVCRALLILLMPFWAAAACADEALYVAHCGVCHALGEDEPPRQGPPLGDVVGRAAGSVPNFPYSAGLKSLAIEWNRENLDRWLTDPQAMVPDSYMIYRQQDPQIRDAVITFLYSRQ